MLSFVRMVLSLCLKGTVGGQMRLSIGMRLFLGLLALLLGALIGIATGSGCQLLNLGELLSPSAKVGTSQPAPRAAP